jgi:hypothetical protein
MSTRVGACPWARTCRYRVTQRRTVVIEIENRSAASAWVQPSTTTSRAIFNRPPSLRVALAWDMKASL